MKAVSLNSSRHLSTTPRPGVLEGLARRLVLRQLRGISQGTLVIRDGAQLHTFGQSAAAESGATITVKDSRFYADVAFGGSIGAAESWMNGYWDCDDLVSLVRILARNIDLVDGMEGGLAWLSGPLQKLFHWVNRNTRSGARRNIAAHYDLGNDFFALWLDPGMMYSCAIFERPDATLAEAQHTRLERVCERLDLQPTDHLVEIGTGWGTLAIHAASRYGCRVTTTTISKEQYELARQRIAAAGLADRITLVLEDYRDLTGQYDKLVSLEMIEAIGYDQYEAYFSKCAQLLRPGGRMLIQAITIADDRFERYRRNVDFIQRYIFPGSCIPSEQVMRETIERVGAMRIKSIDDIGLHYATTLNHWRGNFNQQLDAVRALGYPEEFIRMWNFYLCYCEGGFLERSISDVLLVAERD
ncbi:MAG: cyclopropane-fatty-acyl-phospholipid synthase family protein [Gammaproteobacteria bacterium]|nr:cyclopropane-fatty-acyl-phospholipid synthase family protein [Gammaproteobacteria bacterium]